MPTPAELRAEIESGPLAAELATAWADTRRLDLRNIQIAAVLNDRRFEGKRPVSTVELERLAFRRGVISKLEIGKDNVSDTVRGLCRTALRVFDGQLSEVDMENAATIALFDGLVTAGIFNEADRAAAFGLADSTISRAEQEWGAGTAIEPADVEAARHA